jgi:ubiquinone/menaquinone biosynthesis C-methylase UbiE
VDYKCRVAQCYDGLAAKYDLTIGKTTFGTLEELFNNIDRIPDDPVVLDVGCGTGTAVFELMRKLKDHGRFLGIDVSKEMVAVARTRAVELGLSNLSFEVMDAENLTLAKNRFDFVFSNQVFHWISNRGAMLRGVYDCLKPGGELAFVFQGQNSYKELYHAYQTIKERNPAMDLLDQPVSLTVEETKSLLKDTGFSQINAYAIKQSHYISPLLFLQDDNAEIAPWTTNLTRQDIAVLQKQLISELMKIKPKATLRTQIETVYCFAKKQHS